MEKIKFGKHSKIIRNNLNNIGEIIEFPGFIKEMVLLNLKTFDLSQVKNTDKIKFNNLIQTIENISDQSMKGTLKIIYNQACVLAVSALSAILEKHFVNLIIAHWRKMDFSKEDVKITLAELADYKFNIKPFLGNILLKKLNSINFQDLQSTIRSFDKYCKKKIKLDKDVEETVIFYQQCRHIIVHKNGYVDNEFIKKVGSNIIKLYQNGEKIELNELDWEKIKNSFPRLVDIITSQKSEYDLDFLNSHSGK